MYHSVTNYIGNKRLICSGGDDAMQIQGKSWAVVESREALETYERLLRDILTKKLCPMHYQDVTIGSPGGAMSDMDVYAYPKVGDLWYATYDFQGSRYWNAFGIKENIRNGCFLGTDCEINPPQERLNRRSKGVFLSNGKDVLLGHRGGFGGRKSTTISREDSFRLLEQHKEFQGLIINAQDGDQETPIIVVSKLPLNQIKSKDLRFVRDIYGFVCAVRSLKFARKSETELPEYDAAEEAMINDWVDRNEGEEARWQGEKVKKEFIKSPDTIRAIPKRDSKRAERALRIAGYQCEYNKDDRLFIRKNGKCGYTEPHHLIPLSHYDDFKYSLDVEENIVSLCSHCHNLLHYGRFQDKKPILQKLYKDRKQALAKVGITLHSLEDLYQYYR